ncbi:MAG: DNA circularization N-terminal domain-containing protein [Hyphomicrobium sp.]|uniref:DNA circularization N-terminal domain-containing protein n=1 Tax=Hyphomicrobium sp. TaxID=82 RepID=UPI003D114BB2
MADTITSPWKRGLRDAKFRGIAFHVRDREVESGRRIALHEYPKRDAPFPEDMGKATREWSVDAYVIGDDYMARRDSLLKACEREGPGSYVDHWGVSQRVACRRIRLMETSHEGRMCRFSIDFVEAGGGLSAAAPIGIAATAVQLATSAASLITSAVASYNTNFSR